MVRAYRRFVVSKVRTHYREYPGAQSWPEEGWVVTERDTGNVVSHIFGSREAAEERRKMLEKTKLEGDVYHGTLQELLVDYDTLEVLRYWDDLDEVDTESGKFTVRYIFQSQLSQVREQARRE